MTPEDIYQYQKGCVIRAHMQPIKRHSLKQNNLLPGRANAHYASVLKEMRK